MITVSLCMIVKNEEAVLARCLDTVVDLVDEIIIVDTGSTDHTRDIAANYTTRIYDFLWENDFSDARNFSFSKATMDYIYCADADEILDEVNRRRFLQLKSALLPEIEIVQMKYVTVSEFNTVLNAQKEYRPKLFRRVRSFQWIDPIHETIRTTPVVYDSEIEILHKPQSLHSKRDFHGFQIAYAKYGFLSNKLHSMYARELFISGSDQDFVDALPIFEATLSYPDSSELMLKEASCVLAHIYRTQHSVNCFFKLALKDMLTTPCSEICCELGRYFQIAEDYEEAIMWFYNAAFETKSILDVHTSGTIPLSALADCYETLSQIQNDSSLLEQVWQYRDLANKWSLPVEYE